MRSLRASGAPNVANVVHYEVRFALCCWLLNLTVCTDIIWCLHFSVPPQKKPLVSCPTITALPYHCRKLVLCALWSAICAVLLVAEFKCTDIIWCLHFAVPPQKKPLVSCPTITALPYHCRKLVLCALWSAICAVLLAAEFNCTDIIWCLHFAVPPQKKPLVSFPTITALPYHCRKLVLCALWSAICAVLLAAEFNCVQTSFDVYTSQCPLKKTVSFLPNHHCATIPLPKTSIVCIMTCDLHCVVGSWI